MSLRPGSKESVYISGLVKESILLTDKLAKINKKIEDDLNSHKSALVKWVDSFGASHTLEKKAGEKVAEVSLKPIIEGIIALTRGTGVVAKFVATKGAGVVVGLLVPSDFMNERQAYLDENPQMQAESERIINRLNAINAELFNYMPPSNYSQLSMQRDRCAVEACLRN